MLLGTHIKKLWKRLAVISSTSKHLTFDGKINNNEVTYAEIRWVFKTLVSGFSMNLVDNVWDTFQKCFQTVA